MEDPFFKFARLFIDQLVNFVTQIEILSYEMIKREFTDLIVNEKLLTSRTYEGRLSTSSTFVSMIDVSELVNKDISCYSQDPDKTATIIGRREINYNQLLCFVEFLTQVVNFNDRTNVLSADLVIFYFITTQTSEYMWIIYLLKEIVIDKVNQQTLRLKSELFTNIAFLYSRINESTAWGSIFTYNIYDSSLNYIEKIPYGVILLWYLNSFEFISETELNRKSILMKACHPFIMLTPCDHYIRNIKNIKINIGMHSKFEGLLTFIDGLDLETTSSTFIAVNFINRTECFNSLNLQGTYNSYEKRTMTFVPSEEESQKKRFYLSVVVIEKFILSDRPDNGKITPNNIAELLVDVLTIQMKNKEMITEDGWIDTLGKEGMEEILYNSVNSCVLLDMVSQYSTSIEIYYFLLIILFKIFPLKFPRLILAQIITNHPLYIRFNDMVDWKEVFDVVIPNYLRFAAAFDEANMEYIYSHSFSSKDIRTLVLFYNQSFKMYVYYIYKGYNYSELSNIRSNSRENIRSLKDFNNHIYTEIRSDVNTMTEKDIFTIFNQKLNKIINPLSSKIDRRLYAFIGLTFHSNISKKLNLSVYGKMMTYEQFYINLMLIPFEKPRIDIDLLNIDFIPTIIKKDNIPVELSPPRNSMFIDDFISAPSFLEQLIIPMAHWMLKSRSKLKTFRNSLQYLWNMTNIRIDNSSEEILTDPSDLFALERIIGPVTMDDIIEFKDHTNAIFGELIQLKEEEDKINFIATRSAVEIFPSECDINDFLKKKEIPIKVLILFFHLFTYEPELPLSVKDLKFKLSNESGTGDFDFIKYYKFEDIWTTISRNSNYIYYFEWLNIIIKSNDWKTIYSILLKTFTKASFEDAHIINIKEEHESYQLNSFVSDTNEYIEMGRLENDTFKDQSIVLNIPSELPIGDENSIMSILYELNEQAPSFKSLNYEIQIQMKSKVREVTERLINYLRDDLGLESITARDLVNINKKFNRIKECQPFITENDQSGKSFNNQYVWLEYFTNIRAQYCS
jgi:hypothetical protein